MLSETIRQPVMTLFWLCVVSAAMGAFVKERRAGLSIDGICALGAAICALRAVHEMIF